MGLGRLLKKATKFAVKASGAGLAAKAASSSAGMASKLYSGKKKKKR